MGMDKPQQTRPFRPLGRRLKALRVGAKETLAEVSGSVEIDVREMAAYELGQSRPSEEILLLLISHFNAQDEEAVRLWSLAGYGVNNVSILQVPDNAHQVHLAIPQAENPILFTDIVDVTVNNYGVVMNFMQNSGPGKQPASVSRIGMSREHAKSVMQILQTTLNQTQQHITDVAKKLPSPDEANKTDNTV